MLLVSYAKVSASLFNMLHVIVREYERVVSTLSQMFVFFCMGCFSDENSTDGTISSI